MVWSVCCLLASICYDGWAEWLVVAVLICLVAALFGLLCWLTDCLVASCSALLVFVVWCLLFPGYFLFVGYCVLVSWVVVILFVCLRFLVCFTYGFAGAFVVVVSCVC